MHDESSTALMTEFIALGNHRKAVKVVMVENAWKFRRMQLERFSGVLESYGLDPKLWPPAAVIVLLSGIAWFVRTDESFGVELGGTRPRARRAPHGRWRGARPTSTLKKPTRSWLAASRSLPHSGALAHVTRRVPLRAARPA